MKYLFIILICCCQFANADELTKSVSLLQEIQTAIEGYVETIYKKCGYSDDATASNESITQVVENDKSINLNQLRTSLVFANPHRIELKNYERKEVLRELKNKCNIRIIDDGPLFSSGFLAYLLSYCEVMELGDEREILLSTTGEAGPKLVWRDNKSTDSTVVLKFGSNASNELIGSNFSEVVNTTFELNGEVKRVTTQSTHFSNTIFEQLNRAIASEEAIKKVIENQYNFSLSARSSDPQIEDYREFSKEELGMVLKTFIDLPDDEIVNRLKLKRILRLKKGKKIIINGKEFAAYYNPNSEEIVMSDLAFAGITSSTGEGTFIHELGHAYYHGMPQEDKDNFEDISWENGKVKPGFVEFISTYAENNVNEDFAEHFSSYVNQPELLRTEAPSKLLYFRSDIFNEVEYYSFVRENLVAYVESLNEDVELPYFKNEQLIDFQVDSAIDLKYVEEPGKNPKLLFEINGAVDHNSGIDSLSFNLNHEDKDKLKGHWEHSAYQQTINLVPHKSKKDTFVGEFELSPGAPGSLERMYPGKYELGAFKIYDKKGNFSNYRLEQSKSVQIPGTHEHLKYDISTFSDKKIKLTQTGKSNNHTLYNISLPIPHNKNLSRVMLDLYHTSYEGVFDFYPKLLSKEGDETIELKIAIPDNMKTGELFLSNIKIDSKQKNGSGYSQTRIDLPDHLTNTRISISDVAKNDTTEPKVMENNVKLEVVTVDKNDINGDTVVIATVPVENIDKGYGGLSAVLQSPAGKQLTSEVMEFNSASNNVYYYGEKTNFNSVEKINGKMYFKIAFHLPPNHEKGDYMLTHLSPVEVYSTRADNDDIFRIAPSTGSQGYRHNDIKLLERGIKYSITTGNNREEGF